MSGKHLIGIVVALLVIAIVLFLGVGLVLVRKNGFDGIRTMLGESELDKLINKINSRLQG